MRNHTDSHIVSYNDDGSRTETTVVTYEKVGPLKQTAAWAGLITLCFAPVAPILGLAAYERWSDKREARKVNPDPIIED